MTKYVSLPPTLPAERHVPFYLAMEEYVARHLQEPDCFFLWQVEPSVIFGRNQVVQNEVNIAFCRENGIHMCRRKSGGGCVYADLGNIMFSYITRDEDVNLTFQRFIGMLVLVLRRLGVEATGTVRNDVLVEGKKVSGTAFYHLPGASIVHGTMLYDTILDFMVNAITPPQEKLQKNGVQSVRQRIGLLKDYITLTLPEFAQAARQILCGDEELLLTQADVDAIREIEKQYLDEQFIMKQ